MKVRKVLIAVFLAITVASLIAQEFEVPDTTGMSWYKGNTHAHSKRSVGDLPPAAVARWYKDNGYQFLVLTDDVSPNKPETFDGIADTAFLAIPGLEIKSFFGFSQWIHTNGLNTQSPINPQEGNSPLEVLQAGIDAIRVQGGVPQINHPRYKEGPGREAMLAARNYSLIEIYNGYCGPFVTDDSGFPATEFDWDYLLTAGKRIYGVACDDYRTRGYGWVVVRASKLDAKEILGNLEKGQFYASNGVELDDIAIEPKRITIRIRAEEGVEYLTDFIGAGGSILASTTENPAAFVLTKYEKYVRARVIKNAGRVAKYISKQAWVQPVFVR